MTIIKFLECIIMASCVTVGGSHVDASLTEMDYCFNNFGWSLFNATKLQ